MSCHACTFARLLGHLLAYTFARLLDELKARSDDLPSVQTSVWGCCVPLW